MANHKSRLGAACLGFGAAMAMMLLVGAGRMGGERRCVGVAANEATVYRAFDDGTVEQYMRPEYQWKQVGK